MRSVRISDEIRQKIIARANSSGLRNPVAAILEGQWSDESELALHLGFYERDQIPDDEEIEVLDAGGLELLTVQRQICMRLLDGVLALQEGRIIISTDDARDT